MTAQFCVDVKEAKLAQSLFLAWLDMTQENTFAISFRLFKVTARQGKPQDILALANFLPSMFS